MKETLKFLQDLSLNNNKEWFDANKALAGQSDGRTISTVVKELLS